MPEASVIATNIERLLQSQGMTANAVSVKAGLPRDAVRDILSGKSKFPRADTIMKIAVALGVDAGSILVDPGQPRPGHSSHVDELILPIRFSVAAGAWRELEDYADPEPRMASVPAAQGYEKFPQWLERVEGDSMDRLIPAGSLVHVVDAIALHYEPRHDDIVVVERTRAQGALIERSLKQLEVGPEGMALWPRSHNSRWSQPLALTDGPDDEDLVVQIVGVVIRALIDFR